MLPSVTLGDGCPLRPLGAPHICLTSELPINWLSSLLVLSPSSRLTVSPVTSWRSCRAFDSVLLRINTSQSCARPSPSVSPGEIMSTATRQYMPPNGRLQTTNLVRYIHLCSGVSSLTHPWVRLTSRMCRAPLRPCSRRRSSCRKRYASGACRVHLNSTSATSTYAWAQNSTRPWSRFRILAST